MGSGIIEYPTTSATSLPTGVVAGSDGNLWVTEYSSKELAAFTSTGVFVKTIGVSGAPYAITSVPDGTLWFTENGPTPYIGKASPTGGLLAEYPLPAGANPQGITYGPDGNIWFVEYGASKVGRITPTGSVTTYSLSANSDPENIVTGSDGNLWVTESVGNRIARVTSGGSITEFTVPTKLGTPWGIALGPDGNLWFTEVGSSKIGRITTAGVITEFSLGSCCGQRPTDIVTGPDNNLWFTESTVNILGRITTAGVVTKYTLPTSNSTPDGITVGPDRSIWWAESHVGQIGKLPWLQSSQQIEIDPFDTQYNAFANGLIGPLDGNQQTVIPLDPFVPCNCGLDSSAGLPSTLSLTYNSDTVDVRPIIETNYHSDPNGPVPTQIQVQLTWNGTVQPPVIFSTSGHSPGDVYLLNTQVANPVTATGAYPWKVEVQATLPDGNIVDSTTSGMADVVVNGPSDPLGQGWSVGGTAHLYSDGNGGYFWVDGNGGSRDFQAGSGNAFVSPPNDLGTLVKNGSGGFTYTAPQQDKWNFNSQGLLTSVVQPDGPTETFAYNSAGNPVTITEPGGWATTFTYNSSGQLTTLVEPGNRVLTFTYDSSDDLTSATMPDGSLRTFTYDSVGHMVTDSLGVQNTTYAYDTSTGTLSGANQGLGSTLGLVPSAIQGLQTSPAISASQGVAVETDALGHLTTYTLDSLGQPTKIQTPDGGVQTTQYDFAGQPTVETDALGRVTTYTYQYGAGAGELTQVTNPDGSTTRYQYDPTFHQVALEQDPLGRVTTYTYNSQGDLITTTNPLGGVTTDVWSNGLLQSETDPLGHTTTYQYNSQREEIAEINPLGGRTTYSYDKAGNQTMVEDPLDRVTTYVYDGMRRIVKEIDALGGVTTYTYDPQGDITSQTDPLGRTTRYVYDQRGLETAEIDAVGTPVQRTTTYSYDALGQRISQTNANDHTTTYAYDAVGNLIATTDALGGVTTDSYNLDNELISTTDPLSRVTTYSYDVMGRRTGETDAVGTPVERTTTTVYDAVGNVIETIDALGRVTTYSYDALNRQTAETDAVGTSIQRTTTTVYDAVDNVIETIDALGRVTTYSYDALNRQTAETDAVGTSIQRTTTTVYDAVDNVIETIDAIGGVTSYSYDALDRQVSVTDPLGLTTTTVYDADSNVIATIDPRGFTTSYIYDALNREIETIDALGGIATTVYDADNNVIETIDPLGNATTYEYDALNRQTSLTDPLGRTTTTVYDADNNIVATIDPLNFATTYTYDALNRQTSVENPGGGITTTIYDADNNVIGTTDPLDNSTTYVYDSLNRQVETIDPLGAVTTYLYDKVGNEVGLIDPDGNRTTFVYDALDRKVEEESPLDKSTTYVYDALDRQTSTTDPLGQTIKDAYDADGRLVSETWYDSSNTLVNTQTYTYDADGNLLTAQDSGGLYTMTYDALDRVITDEDPFGMTLAYTYDAAGNRTLVQDSLGGVTTYVYDADHELTSEVFGGAGQTPLRVDMTYDSRGELLTETRYSNLPVPVKVGESIYTYDGDGQITNVRDQDGSGNVIGSFTYTYDLADRVRSEDNLGLFTTYTYDADGQLTSDSTAGYSYDAAGNRNGAGIVIGPGNQLLSDGDWTYTYDADGNLIEKVGVSTGPDKNLTWTYTYDIKNQMSKAVETKSGTTLQTVIFQYDVFGNRIQEDYTNGMAPTQVTRFAYDGENIWADLDGTNSLVMRRLFLNTVDSVTARITASGTVAWYLADRQGSVRVLVDSTGAVIDRINFDGFGNIISESNAAESDRYLYTGREFDRATGLQYNRARYYDPATGRWITPDPLGFAGGDSNLYRYAKNDPTNAVDPSGDTIYILLDANKAADLEKLQKAAAEWNTQIDKAIELIEQKMDKIGQKKLTYRIAGQEVDRAKFVAYLKTRKMEVVSLPAKNTQGEAIKSLQDFLDKTTKDDQVDFESHSSADIADKNKAFAIHVANVDVPIEDLLKDLKPTKSVFVLGVCNITDEQAKAFAQKLKTTVGGSGGESHKISDLKGTVVLTSGNTRTAYRALNGTLTGKTDYELSFGAETPYDLAQFKQGPPKE